MRSAVARYRQVEEPIGRIRPGCVEGPVLVHAEWHRPVTDRLGIGDQAQLPGGALILADGDVGTLTGRERQEDGAVLVDDAIAEVATHRERSRERALGGKRKADRWFPGRAPVQRSGDVRAAETE